jgi:hypothetical protein
LLKTSQHLACIHRRVVSLPKGEYLAFKRCIASHWRSEFARNLRLLGIEANATESAVRREYRKAKKDGNYRANLRNDSTYLRGQASVAELPDGIVPVDSGKRALVETRREIEYGWQTIARKLHNVGHRDLASEVVWEMPPPRTEKGVERSGAAGLPCNPK